MFLAVFFFPFIPLTGLVKCFSCFSKDSFKEDLEESPPKKLKKKDRLKNHHSTNVSQEVENQNQPVNALEFYHS